MGTYKDQSELTGPLSEECMQADQDQDMPVGVLAREAHAPPFPKRPKNPSHTDLPTRKKHNAVLSRLLNANPLAEIIGSETVADVIINDAEACALLDSRATADLMSSAYTEARGFNVRLITKLSDQYVNLNLVFGYSSPVTGYVEYNLRVRGISSYDSDQVTPIAKDDTQFFEGSTTDHRYKD